MRTTTTNDGRRDHTARLRHGVANCKRVQTCTQGITCGSHQCRFLKTRRKTAYTNVVVGTPENMTPPSVLPLMSPKQCQTLHQRSLRSRADKTEHQLGNRGVHTNTTEHCTNACPTKVPRHDQSVLIKTSGHVARAFAILRDEHNPVNDRVHIREVLEKRWNSCRVWNANPRV
mmetsp:Transcript_21796/g.57771  ORF Transcript_21796/g.57771 Transcript_21796/m.57771 type:complete len:173 (-) Transcript_21796:218-736(-)